MDLLSPRSNNGSDAESARAVAASARRACEAEEAGLLLRLHFTTLFEYLKVRSRRRLLITAQYEKPRLNIACTWTSRLYNCATQQMMAASVPFRTPVCGVPQSLKAIAGALEPLGPTACFYMAAAVSDFYLPWADMAQHKIQSSAGPLELTLPKVRDRVRV